MHASGALPGSPTGTAVVMTSVQTGALLLYDGTAVLKEGHWRQDWRLACLAIIDLYAGNFGWNFAWATLLVRRRSTPASNASLETRSIKFPVRIVTDTRPSPT